MATVTLKQRFSFLTAQDWDWVMTFHSATRITISDGVHTQDFVGNFTYGPGESVSGTVTSTEYKLNGVSIYTVTGMSDSAAKLAAFAKTDGDTQATYAYILRGNDTITGSTGHDTLLGYNGNDRLNGKAGADKMYGGNGSDSYYVDNPKDVVTETNATASAGGVDTVYSYLANYTLGANVENGRILSTGASNLTGNAGANRLNGGAGNNSLNGLGGNDTLNGGLGNDLYKYALGQGNDVITDTGGYDTLELHDPKGLAIGVNAYRSGDNLVIDFMGQGRVTVIDQFLGASTAIEKLVIGSDLSSDAGPFNILRGFNGTSGADVLVGTSLAETLKGNAGDDLIFANQGNDTIYGGDGDDEIWADTGNDAVFGGNGSDDIHDDAGKDTINGGADWDTAIYNDQSAGVVVNLSGVSKTFGGVTLADGSVYEKSTKLKDTLISIESVEGSYFADVFYGGKGSYEGAAGNDIFYGGVANTSISISYHDDPAGVKVNLSDAEIIVNGVNVASRTARDGWGNTDTIHLAGGYISLRSSDYNDYIRGRDDMSNSLNGRRGNDTLHGGSSDYDTARYDNDSVTRGVIVNLSAAAITYSSITVAANHARDGYGYTDTLISIESVEGSPLSDYILGSSRNNYLAGEDGNDSINGGAGNDYLVGDNGNDALNGGTGADNMEGGNGSDTYYVDNFNDFVRETNGSVSGGIDQVNSYLTSYTLGNFVENGRILLASAANLTGNSLNNLLYAGKGNNILSGGAGTDTVSYLYGANGTKGVTVSLVTSNAQATGGSGSDKLISIERLIGSRNSDSLTGNGGANVLNGGKGNDTLNGRAGNDLIIGGIGKDKLIGGSGNDSFDFNALNELGLGDNRDVVTDFTRGQDKIDLSTIDANAGLAGNQAFKLISSTATFNAAGQIRYSAGIVAINTDADAASEFEIQLTGTVPASLNATDFVL